MSIDVISHGSGARTPARPDAVPAYRSTRGGGERYTFEEALLKGLAADGGLFLPDVIPALGPGDWRDATSIAELGERVLGRWIGSEIEAGALRALVHDALDFPVPLVPLEGRGWEDVFVLELFHGPTLSFKDFGARTMARLMSHFLEARGESLTILVATSGDTGSAVADGFAGLKGIDVVLLYPKGQVSAVQERQLVVDRPGVRALAVEGTFDDCQRMVKEAFLDPELRGLRLSSANSINIGRLLPQMLYYLWAVRVGGFEEAVPCVPSGNLGNLTAGVLAALSGMPAARFVAAHNANDFFPRHLSDGEASFGPSVRTLSNAMDVGAPSNFERLEALFPQDVLSRWVWATSVTDEETRASMRRIWETAGYVADPHTAVGLEAARRFRAAGETQAPIFVLSTAHPSKFPETVEEVLGTVPETPERLAELWECPVRVRTVVPSLAALRAVLVDGVR